jgi:hypothetical protein
MRVGIPFVAFDHGFCGGNLSVSSQLWNLISASIRFYEAYSQNKFRCKYCRCSAAVTMVSMLADFVGPFGRHGRHLQTIEPRLRIVLSVYNVQENREARRM